MISDLIERTLGKDIEEKELFLVTANHRGVVHADLVHNMEIVDGKIRVHDRFSPLILSDLEENKHVTLVIWTPKTCQGYQLEGDWKELKEEAVADGYLPGQDESAQSKWDLKISINSIIPFRSHQKNRIA